MTFAKQTFGTARQAHKKDDKESAFIHMKKAIEEKRFYSSPFVLLVNEKSSLG